MASEHGAGTPEQLVGRLAPSPTGHLHLGHARSFLLAFWQMRSLGGRLVLRLEDLDSTRVRQPLIDGTLYDLEWLGLDWDGRVSLQSEHLERIREAARSLEQRDLAYPCWCTRADLRAVNAPHAGDQEPRYPGTCRSRARAHAPDAPHALRFVVPSGPVTLVDGFAGAFTCDVQAEVGDFLIVRRDGVPSYQLAVVVDDAAQGVTHVLRGDDLLASAARQYHLQRALRVTPPSWFHVPLVCDEAGRRLAKRTDDLSLTELRERGVDPRALVAWAARSAGLSVPERVTALEVVPLFDLAHVPRDNVRLTPLDVARLRDSR